MGLACAPPRYVVYGEHTLPQVTHAFPSFFKNVQSPVDHILFLQNSDYLPEMVPHLIFDNIFDVGWLSG
jgi:hypothetical protein